MKNYRIVCTYQGDVCAVQEQVEKDDHTTDWMEVHRCTAKGEEGYNEAKEFIKVNGKTKEEEWKELCSEMEKSDNEFIKDFAKIFSKFKNRDEAKNILGSCGRGLEHSIAAIQMFL